MIIIAYNRAAIASLVANKTKNKLIGFRETIPEVSPGNDSDAAHIRRKPFSFIIRNATSGRWTG